MDDLEFHRTHDIVVLIAALATAIDLEGFVAWIDDGRPATRPIVDGTDPARVPGRLPAPMIRRLALDMMPLRSSACRLASAMAGGASPGKGAQAGEREEVVA